MTQDRFSVEQKRIMEEIRNQLRETMRVMRMQSLGLRDRPARMQAFWTAYNNRGDAGAGYRRAIGPKATPTQITAMERMLDLLLGIDPAARKIVMARAGGIPWRRLEEMDGRSHTTLRKIEAAALLEIANAATTRNSHGIARVRLSNRARDGTNG